jgi:hypothetical protein
MKAPVWYLPAKISSLTGGDGWHRSYLMDTAFGDFSNWWLAGMDIEQTKEWFPYTVVTGGADITNQYLAFGLDAGLLAMVLFILLIVAGFNAIGRALMSLHTVTLVSSETEYLLWGLGCTLAVHISTWFGITYTFDQTYVIWFMQLAAISSISQTGVAISSQSEQRAQKTSRIRQSIYKKDHQHKDPVFSEKTWMKVIAGNNAV